MSDEKKAEDLTPKKNQVRTAIVKACRALKKAHLTVESNVKDHYASATILLELSVALNMVLYVIYLSGFNV